MIMRRGLQYLYVLWYCFPASFIHSHLMGGILSHTWRRGGHENFDPIACVHKQLSHSWPSCHGISVSAPRDPRLTLSSLPNFSWFTWKRKLGSPIAKIPPPTYTLNRHMRRHQSETQPPGTCSRILGNCDCILKRLFWGWIEQLKPFSSLQTLSPPFLTNPALRCPNCKLGPQPSESYNQSNRTTWSLCRLCARLNRNSIFVTPFGPRRQPPMYHAQR